MQVFSIFGSRRWFAVLSLVAIVIGGTSLAHSAGPVVMHSWSALSETVDKAQQSNRSWGKRLGAPVEIKWSDLMPAGDIEALENERRAFIEALALRYAFEEDAVTSFERLDSIEEGSELDYMPQFGSFDTVRTLDGEYVRISGYIVPFDMTSKFRQHEFLFVPTKGACIHSPPPPPNQVILIRAKPALRVRDIWIPYSIEGTLQTESSQSDIGDAAYSLEIAVIEKYSSSS